MNLHEIMLRPVVREEEPRFKALLEAHHYLGAVAKIGHTIWYVATWREQWLALLVVGAAAWKCAARDRWIGWDRRYQYDRLHLIGNNVRFLILPEAHVPNLASRVL
ncbi:Druantia anti-phage system protein DruA, partial [Thiohalocapsa halophila]